MLKKNISILLLSSCVILSVQGVSNLARGLMVFVKPNQIRVQEHTKKITWEKEVNKMLRYTVAAIGASAGVYIAYSLYEYIKTPKAIETATTTLSNAELTQQFQELKNSCRPSLVRSITPQILIFLAPKIINKIFQEYTVEEYVSQKTRMWQTFADLEKYAHDFDIHNETVVQNADIYERLVPIAYRNLIEDVEHIIGYMRYRSGTITAAEKQQDAHHITHLLFVASINFSHDLSKIVHATNNVLSLKDCVIHFKIEIEKLLSTFARLEQE